MTTATAAVLVEDVHKRYGDVVALDGVSLEVPQGRVLGLLGPNGAGKTTLVRILTTLLAPDAGAASVIGHDVVRDAAALRGLIGLAGQYAAVDGQLTGRENLRMVGRLYGLSRRDARTRADQLLGRFELLDAADRPGKTYSGGMRRRLDLAASLVGRPRVLFLDEPTTGLDPRSRLELWELIAELVAEGTTLLLTTQYLEEADRLADTIAVIDHGRLLAEGTPTELKRRMGGDVLHLLTRDRAAAQRAAGLLHGLGAGSPKVDDAGEVTVAVADGTGALVEAVRRLDGAGLEIADLGLRRPTLDDVFLTLTGQPVAPSPDPTPGGSAPSRSAA